MIRVALGLAGSLFIACPMASAARLKPNYVACDNARNLTAYTSAVAANNRVLLRSLWDKNCFSTNRLAHVQDVQVLSAGPLITLVHVAAGHDTLDLWTFAEAVAP